MKLLITEITEIEIIPVKPKGGLICFASFVLDQKYYLSSVAIYTRLDGSGYRLVYPTKKVGNKNINIFHPINNRVSKIIDEAVIEKVNVLFDTNLKKDYEN
jgi:DNA-binding cell septation regulator SpoVG